MKKMCIALLAACAVAATCLPAHAHAVLPFQRQALVRKVIFSLRLQLEALPQTRELAGLRTNTHTLLDELEAALRTGDARAVQIAAENYAAGMQPLEQSLAKTLCGVDLAFSLMFQVPYLLTAAAAEGTPACRILNVTDITADIIISMQYYDLCLMDTLEEPDNATRLALIKKQTAVKTYGFIASALNLALCEQSIGLADGVNLLLEFISIFP